MPMCLVFLNIQWHITVHHHEISDWLKQMKKCKRNNLGLNVKRTSDPEKSVYENSLRNDGHFGCENA